MATANGKKNAGQWPSWLTPGKEPALYKQVWAHVGLPNGLADTTKTSALLLTSRMTTDTLGYIWSLTNLTVPGSLTQQELYVSLALVALAQNGYTFTNSNVVKQLLEAPMPKLELNPCDTLNLQPFSNVNTPALPSPTNNLSTTSQPLSVINLQMPLTGQQTNVPTVTETLSLLDISSEPVSLLESSPVKTLSVLSATDLNNDYSISNISTAPEESLIFGDFQANEDDFDDFKSADAFMTSMNNLTVLDVKDPLDLVNISPLNEFKDVQPQTVHSNSDDFSIFDDLGDVTQPQTSVQIPLEVETCDTTSQHQEKAYVEDLFPKCVLKTKSPPCEKASPECLQPPVLPSLSVVEEDRYSALRILDCSIQGDEHQEFDEFGDFLTASAPVETPLESPLQTNESDVQLKCLEACLQLLKEAVNILESIEDTKVLEEVTSDERGRTFLEEIVEVERIGRRIRSNREKSQHIAEFESLSQSLQPFIESVKNNHMEEQEGPKCGLCQMEYGPAHVKYGINHFHAPCANLYLHKVDAVLPIAPVM
ncbi:uncharacterized protein LOC106669415 isoform X2 [Cimex lectularius]|uniref:EH domain-containing protein n=1 Tax=Cimex lectularius TaxID=79782 RepID=A0A8I6RXP8_CIMLE|nr:uncharacterized protein LOC106669415 isoform X2 [Cimex lectularius]